VQSASAVFSEPRAAAGRSGYYDILDCTGAPDLLLRLLTRPGMRRRDDRCVQTLPENIWTRRFRWCSKGGRRRRLLRLWPKAEEGGVWISEERTKKRRCAAVRPGSGLAIWEKPVISRLVSLEHSHEIKPGMVFALVERLAFDGWRAPRGLKKEMWSRKTGHVKLITRFRPISDG